MKDSAERSPSLPTGTESAERVADVLLTFLNVDGEIGVSAIARELSISKAVVHRILQSLVSRGLVRFNADSYKYSLGPSSTAIGARALRRLDLRIAAHDALIDLRNETQETTTVSLLVVDKRTYVDQYESPQEIKMTVELGRLYPLYAGASGRVILAFLPESDVARVISSGLEPLTDATVHEPDELRAQLANIRRDGYAASRGERQSGAGAVAAPIFSGIGGVIGSISICGPLARYDSDAVARYIPRVKAVAAKISSDLAGHRSAG